MPLQFLPTMPSAPAPKQVYLLFKEAQIHGVAVVEMFNSIDLTDIARPMFVDRAVVCDTIVLCVS